MFAWLRASHPWWRLPALGVAYTAALLFGLAVSVVLIWAIASATT